MNYYRGQQESQDEPNAHFGSWHRTRGSEDQRTSLQFWLAIVALGCVSLAAVTFGASAALARKDAGKPLLAGLVLPKLISSHGERKAEPFHIVEPHPSKVAPLVDLHPAAAPKNLPAVVEHRGASVELPSLNFSTPEPPFALVEMRLNDPSQPSLVETCDEPVVYLQPCVPQRGDSPMIRTWKTVSLFSLLSAASIVYVPEPVLAQDSNPVRKDDSLERRVKALEDRKPDTDAVIKGLEPSLKALEKNILSELKISIDGLNSEIAAIKRKQLEHQNKLDDQKDLIDSLEKRLTGLQNKLVAGGTPSPSPAVDKASLDEIRSRLNNIQDALAKLGPTEKRTALSMPNGNSNVGRVVLVNLYSKNLLFTVNGVSHGVPAGKSRIIENLPAGPLRYEVWAEVFGVLESQTTTLSGGETYTLTATR